MELTLKQLIRRAGWKRYIKTKLLKFGKLSTLGIGYIGCFLFIFEYLKVFHNEVILQFDFENYSSRAMVAHAFNPSTREAEAGGSL